MNFIYQIKAIFIFSIFLFINAASELVDDQSSTTDQHHSLEDSKETIVKQVFHKLLREILKNVFPLNKQTDVPTVHPKSSTETASKTSQQIERDTVYGSIQQSINEHLPRQL